MTNFAKASLSPCKKMVSFGVSLFRTGFKSSKCKTMAKLSVARIKLLRNKREVVVKQMRRDVALLLQSGQDTTARIRVEHVIREQNIMAANEIIELFCELIVARLSIIAKQRECPADLKEGVCSLIFAAPRCSDIPELLEIRDIFEKKYGKDFVGAATDLRPNCGVNRALIEKLSVRTPTGEVKLKIMKEIAKEYQIEWDTTESEKELLKPPEELIEGPHMFVSATSMPVKPVSSKSAGTNLSSNRLPGNDREEDNLHFDDMASAAKAAADSAEKAVAAAQAAAYLANRDTRQMSNFTGLRNSTGSYIDQYSSDKHAPGKSPSGPGFPMPSDLPVNLQDSKHHSKVPGRMYESQDFDRSHYSSDEEHLQDSRHHSKLPGRMYESQGFDRSRYSRDEELLQGSKHHSELPGRMYESQGFDRSRYSRDEELLQDSKHHSELPGRMYESQGFDRSRYSRDEEHLQDNKHYSELPGRVYGSQGLDRSRYSRDEEHGPVIANNRRINRRHSYSVPAARSDIQFDESGESESECDEEIETEQPSGANCPAPDRLPPPVPSSHSYRQNSIPGVHRKLPDYDTIAARFEALKLRKSS